MPTEMSLIANSTDDSLNIGVNVTNKFTLNVTTPSTPPVDDIEERWAYAYKLSFYFSFAVPITALLLNFVSMVAIRFTRDTLKPSLYLIVHLIVADSVMAASSLSYMTHAYVSEYTRLSIPSKRALQCSMHFTGHFWDTSTFASVLILLCLAAEHLIAIKRPLRYEVVLSRPRLHAIMIVVWIIAIFFGWSTQFLIMNFNEEEHNFKYNPSKGTTRYCYKIIVYYYYNQLTRNNTYGVTAIIISATVIVISLFVMTLTYCLIFRHVLNLRALEALPSGPEYSKRRRSSFSVNKKAIRTTLLLLGVFIVCYMPYFVWIIVSTFANSQDLVSAIPYKSARKFLNLVAWLLLSSNSLFDPVIYAARLHDVRVGYKRLRRVLANSQVFANILDFLSRWRFGNKRKRSRDSTASGSSFVNSFTRLTKKDNVRTYNTKGENIQSIQLENRHALIEED